MAMDPIYLDYAATTPVETEVADRMRDCLVGEFGNPASSGHVFGRRAEALVSTAREQVAQVIGAEPRDVVFTSGATEADNLAITGAARFRADRGRHIVIGASEHKAVLEPCDALEFADFEVTRVPPESDGHVDPARVAAALRPDTIVVSVMHANNETGVVNDIATIGERVRAHGALMHVDAAQTVGKLSLDVAALDIDLLSLSAHKNHGPKGVGALWIRRRPRVRLRPLIVGGGHERGLRAGTLAPHQIVGMGAALARAADSMQDDWQHARALGEELMAALAAVPGWHENGAGAPRLPGIRNFGFAGVDGVSLATALADDVALSTGSACTTGSVEPSHVLRTMGQDAATAGQAVRLSWGRLTSADEVARAGAHIARTVSRLRAADVKAVATYT